MESLNTSRPLWHASTGTSRQRKFRSGEFLGEAFGPGDFDEEDEETVHEPVVTPDGECICLIVTDAPLKFKSRMMRVVQPFLGI